LLIILEERQASVNELANSRRAQLRSSGWPMHYFADQLEQLVRALSQVCLLLSLLC